MKQIERAKNNEEIKTHVSEEKQDKISGKKDLIDVGFPDGSDSKESNWNVEDLDLIPGLGRSPEGGHGNPLQ